MGVIFRGRPAGRPYIDLEASKAQPCIIVEPSIDTTRLETYFWNAFKISEWAHSHAPLQLWEPYQGREIPPQLSDVCRGGPGVRPFDCVIMRNEAPHG